MKYYEINEDTIAIIPIEYDNIESDSHDIYIVEKKISQLLWAF